MKGKSGVKECMETLSAMRENPLTYSVMLSELHKCRVKWRSKGCLRNLYFIMQYSVNSKQAEELIF